MVQDRGSKGLQLIHTAKSCLELRYSGLYMLFLVLIEYKMLIFFKKTDSLGPSGRSCDQTGPPTAVLQSGTVHERSGLIKI